MNKKVTIKDVAEAAGVCKATVSYVLNDRKDQKISEETKKKVWQVVNMLGYRPNAFAQNMRVSHERLMIGVYLPQGLSIPERALCLDFINDFLALSRESNASIILLGGSPERINTADAIVAFSVTREEFFALGEYNFIPILSVDCRIDDDLFFEIRSDYRTLKELADSHFGADYRYACIPPRDRKLQDDIRAVFPDAVFVESLGDCDSLAGKKILVTQRVLAETLSGRGGEVYFPEEVNTKKIRTIAQCIRLALSHEPCEKHIFKV